MTDDAVRRAVVSAIRNAFQLGKDAKPNDPRQLELAQKYAEGLILPVLNARIEQAIEDAHMAERASARTWEKIGP